MPMIEIARLQELLFAKDGALFWAVSRRRQGGLTKIGDRAGCVAANGYRYVGVDGKRLLEHRVIFALVVGRWPRDCLDHINRDISDNRIENLRECSHAENMQNRGMDSRNTTGVTGVYFDKARNSFAAELAIGKKKKYLGRFATLDDAKSARLVAEAKFFPVFGPQSQAHQSSV